MVNESSVFESVKILLYLNKNYFEKAAWPAQAKMVVACFLMASSGALLCLSNSNSLFRLLTILVLNFQQVYFTI